jgi:maltose alpha-D-glucosyltransferase / alpha-amylase
VSNEGDAWQYTVTALSDFFGKALAYGPRGPEQSGGSRLLPLVNGEIPENADELIGHYFDLAGLLGERTAELHLALAEGHGDERFRPEPSTDFSRRSQYQSMRNLTTQVFQSLRQRAPSLPEELQPEIQQLLGLESELLERFRAVNDRRIDAVRIRCHGDFHLEQVLMLGRDLVFIDLEGEVARPLSQRRFKDSPLRDIAGMVSSFRYAAFGALLADTPGAHRAEDMPVLERWAAFWHQWVSAAYLKAYLGSDGIRDLLPHDQDDLQVLLEARLLERAVYELGHELNNRPNWLKVPLRGILNVITM